MAHIPMLLRARTYFSYTLGLRSLARIRSVYQSLDRDIVVQDARFAGVLTIPEQRGMQQNPDGARDNTELGLLDPITWIEQLAGGINTSEFELVHPTITIDATNYYTTQGNVSVLNGRLRVNVAKVATPTAAPGQFFQLGNDPARLYRIGTINTAGTIWHCTPGRLPWGTVGNPAVPDPFTLRFEITNATEVQESLDFYARGPYRIEYLETRK